MKWHPTPEDELITAVRMVGDAWEPCRIENIRKGDVFRMVVDEEPIHPLTYEPDPEAVALAVADARKMDPLGADGQPYGYGAEIIVYDSLDELRRKALS